MGPVNLTAGMEAGSHRLDHGRRSDLGRREVPRPEGGRTPGHRPGPPDTRICDQAGRQWDTIQLRGEVASHRGLVQVS